MQYCKVLVKVNKAANYLCILDATIIFKQKEDSVLKKLIAITIVLMLITGCAQTKAPETSAGGNFTDEMKIVDGIDLDPEYGADAIEREGDHADSPYYNTVDFYNLKSTDTLTILENFKTKQQSSEWSCGVVAIEMILEYYGVRGDYNEESLAMLRPNQMTPGPTTLDQAIAVFEAVGGFELETTRDLPGENLYEEFTLETIKNYLDQGIPVMVCWNDWGAHWQVIIGYDTMGTETTQDDVLIVADSYDTTDHNQDGYGVYPAERFYYNFTTYDFFTEEEGNDMLFIAARPIAVAE